MTMTTKKIKGHQAMQCRINIYENGDIDFISYYTRVISICKNQEGKRIIECTGTYSATTRKQIGYFLREYAPDLSYYDMKGIAGNGYVVM